MNTLTFGYKEKVSNVDDDLNNNMYEDEEDESSSKCNVEYTPRLRKGELKND